MFATFDSPGLIPKVSPVRIFILLVSNFVSRFVDVSLFNAAISLSISLLIAVLAVAISLSISLLKSLFAVAILVFTVFNIDVFSVCT